MNTTSNAFSAQIVYGFDGMNNPTSAKLPTGAKSVTGYTDAANPTFPTSVTDPQGNQVTGLYDATGDLLTTRSVQQNRTLFTYVYNAAGQPTKVTDGEGRFTTYGYDGGGHLTAESPPAPRSSRGFLYDGYDHVTTVYPDGNGHAGELDYHYDALNRLVEIGTTDAADGYTPLQYNNFDANGNLLSRYVASYGVVFTYGSRNELAYAYHKIGSTTDYTIHYVYDGNRNLTDLYDGGGHVSYLYDPANQLYSQTGPTSTLPVTYTVDNAGRRVKTSYPSGFAVSVGYDDSGRQTSLTAATSSGTNLLTRTYKWTSAAGADTNLLQSENRGGTRYDYSYDPLGRLTAQSGTSNTYTLDNAANLTSAEGRTFSINSAGQASSSGGSTYAYDGHGNLNSSSNGGAEAYFNNYSVTDQLIKNNH